MTSPRASDWLDSAADPLVDWQAVVGSAATPAEQARIRTALNLADTEMQAAADPDRLRGRIADPVRDVFAADLTRSRIAALWYQVLTEADAFAHIPATACRFDPAAVRAWLTGPDPSGADTIAAAVGIGDDFDVYGFDKHLRLDALLTAAQTADVFGVPDHQVAVIHLAGDHGYLDRHRITLTTPQQAVLCSPDLDTADLLTEHLSGVDAAVNALGAAAKHTDALLDARTLLADSAKRPLDRTGASSRALAGKAFPPLGAITGDQLDPPPVAITSALPPRRHR